MQKRMDADLHTRKLTYWLCKPVFSLQIHFFEFANWVVTCPRLSVRKFDPVTNSILVHTYINIYMYGTVAVGTVVHVSVDDVDRAKTDETNATLVVVEIVSKGEKQKEDMYRLACAGGVINTLYSRSYIRPLEIGAGLMGLQTVLESWQGMPEVGLRAAMCVVSAVGGQGLVHCACKGDCLKGRCACLKAKRKCNSRCHKGNKKCKNHD